MQVEYLESPTPGEFMGAWGANVPVRGARRSGHWPEVRRAHLESNPSCAACGCLDHPMEVHHIVPVHYDPTKELDPDNLITLCGDRCHLIFGHHYNFRNRNCNVVEDCAKMLAARKASDEERKHHVVSSDNVDE